MCYWSVTRGIKGSLDLNEHQRSEMTERGVKGHAAVAQWLVVKGVGHFPTTL